MDYTRKINIIGDIDETMYSSFVESLDGMDEIDPDCDITVELSSLGGNAMMAIALFERIRLHRGEVTVKAIGPVFSAAALVLAAGDIRIMSKNSWCMLHEDTVEVIKHSRVSQVETDAKNSRLLEDQWNAILADITKVPISKWSELHKREAYLTPKECLALKLVHKVV